MFESLINEQPTILIVVGLLLLCLVIALIIILVKKINNDKKKILELEKQKLSNKEIITTNKEVEIIKTEIPNNKIYENVPTMNNEVSKFDIGEAASKIEENLDNENNIDLTKYEVEQEEKSIISYNELKRKVEEQKNNGVKVVSFDKVDEIKQEMKDKSFNTEVLDFSDITSEYKFKPSEFVSPVNGIEQKDTTKDILDIENLDENIKTSTEFLDALKELKNNLDL